MYENLSGVQEDKGRRFMFPGIHQACIKSIALQQIKTDKYEGSVIDVVFYGTGKDHISGQESKGLESNYRIFPFTHNPSSKDFDGNLKGEKVQAEEYIKRIKHRFNKCVTTDAFDKAMATIKSFDEMAAALVSICPKEKGGKDFWLKVRHMAGYPKVDPWATHGVVEEISDAPVKLIWNVAKDADPGGPSKPTEAANSAAPPPPTAASAEAATNELPWD